jgi:peroxiredoxin
VPFLAHAAQVRPGSFEARRELGAAYLAAGQPEKARHELETAARAQPDVASVHADLAKAYEQLRRPEDVRREREVAAKLSAAAKPDAHDTDLLRPGSMAPDFTLRRKGGNGEVHLAELLGSRPVVLMFGSYTCPKFRFDAPTLNALYERYRAGVEFLMIYVQEAHTGESWESSVNQRERIQLPAPKSLEQKEQNAATCARRLEIRFPMAVDGMDRKVERAYAGWPSAVYILDKDGRIAWRSRLGEVELPADELERAIQQSAAHTAKQQ